LKILELKPLTAELLPAAVELDRLCFGQLWTIEAYQRELNSPNSDVLILDEAHITILAVHPAAQRQGWGQVLLWALLSCAYGRGLARATLEVRASNLGALSLYQKFGFQTAGRRRRYYQDTGEDALILWLGGMQHPNFGQTLASWQQEILARLALSQCNLCISEPKILLDG
jgi:[ribosomal protein S18]-alanine N-acetyltransferase